MSFDGSGELFDRGCVDYYGAEFSDCRTWRYTLWRRWRVDGKAKLLMVIGLNPSTADEKDDDPTIRRCINFAKGFGYGGLLMMNAFAFRATQPKDMQAAADPVGPGNDAALSLWRPEVGMVIAAWGVHCPDDRADTVCRLVDRPVHCLGLTKDGKPKHPLYLRSDTRPQLYRDCLGSWERD